MTSKFRTRPPLLGIDGTLGIHSVYISSDHRSKSTTTNTSKSKRSGVSMECGSLTANANPSSPYTASSSQSSQSSVTMGSKRNSGTNKVGLHVNFDTDKDELQERKKKYLTAKYGQHQMSLIKKRLGVEMWMYERLQYLYGSDDVQCYNDLDLDELLDVDGDFNKKNWLMDKLTETKQSQDEVNKFVDELLERAKIL